MIQKRPADAAEALRSIESTASATLVEMRQLVGILRGADGSIDAPGVPDLADLADSPGVLPVRMHLAEGVDELGPIVGTTLYRIAQEAITNSGRHADGASVIDVTLDWADESRNSVQLQITDDGRASRAPSTAAGYGLVGMKERVDVLGGQFSSGPGDTGGWLTTVFLPIGVRQPKRATSGQVSPG